MRFSKTTTISFLSFLTVVGCSSVAPVEQPSAVASPPSSAPLLKTEAGKADASVLATILDFEFDGELLTDFASPSYASTVIRTQQLLFTIGQLNTNDSVGRLDNLQLSDINVTSEADGRSKITYHAKMPVAWGSKTNLPSSYEFILPRDMGVQAKQAFSDKYRNDCASYSSHEITANDIWYYYRPSQYNCKLDPSDVIRINAQVSVSPVNTTGKFPEYHKVWEDNRLQVVAVFGKYEDGATASGDAGIAAYNEFIQSVRSSLSVFPLTTSPAEFAPAPGVATPDIAFTATLPDGKLVQIHALLVDSVANAGREFYARYEELSTRADLIAYNGHAGLGQNVRALARYGQWVAGQYVIVFMNGCDTYAYVDGSLATTRARVNSDDPSGTKYLDFVVNAMPAYFHADAEASMAMIRGLMDFGSPRTYEQIFAEIDSSQIVLVTGEQDNEYFPMFPLGGSQPDAGTPSPAASWDGVNEVATVAQGEEKRWASPALAAGKYLVELKTEGAEGSGDADLYVRVGTAPSASLYDCRPYLNGSNETCLADVPEGAALHIMVKGYAPASTFRLIAHRQ